MNVTVLVDFENDSVRTALEVADALGDRLWGVRLDTSETLVDVRARGRAATPTSTAASRRCSPAASAPRSTTPATSTCGSSCRAASTPTKIERFEAESSPVDAYGVGSSLLRGEQRLHRRHRARRRPRRGEGRARGAPEPPPRAGRLLDLRRGRVRRGAGIGSGVGLGGSGGGGGERGGNGHVPGLPRSRSPTNSARLARFGARGKGHKRLHAPPGHPGRLRGPLAPACRRAGGHAGARRLLPPRRPPRGGLGPALVRLGLRGRPASTPTAGTSPARWAACGRRR